MSSKLAQCDQCLAVLQSQEMKRCRANALRFELRFRNIDCATLGLERLRSCIATSISVRALRQQTLLVVVVAIW